MKKILFAIFGCFVALCAHAAQIVNVDYIHKIIQQEWDVTVPIRTNNIMAAANMKYLLTAIDVANEILNGEKTTDYGNGEFATLQAADTIATNQAVETLVRKIDKSPKFFLTTTSTNSFSFKISAAGKFYVDWGDGKTETITKPDTTDTTYSHNYDTANTYTIGIGGRATAYNTSTSTAAISFYINSSQTKIASIDGSLGAIFRTLSSDTNKQPRFYRTFYLASNMNGAIPANLFTGISGAPASYMFYQTFNGCSGLTGAIPDGLFAGISGAPATTVFLGTFRNCSGLTGSIPAGLFAGISGAPASYIFNDTFSGCSGLTSIPAGLFAGLSGKPAEEMFANTFEGCSGLTGAIPDGLFGNLTGAPAKRMFDSTFSGCSGLTGAIPAGLFGNLSGKPAVSMFSETFEGCSGLTGSIPDGLFGNLSGAPAENMFFYTFEGCSGLTGAIPAGLFGNLSGKPAVSMFNGTFDGCSGLTGAIPAGLFGNLSGAPARYMFSETFEGCSGLTSIPAGLFAGISGAPASYMFQKTFYGCSGLTGAIPDGLFAGISGAPVENMFYYTFSDCSGLTGAIPNGLFAGISGAPASDMFDSTFSGCSGLTSIPENLFGNISGTAQSGMFRSTFANCTSLTGPSARINGQYLYEIWPNATSSQVGDMYKNANGLSDFLYIPVVWGGLGATTNEYPSVPSDAVYDFYLTTTSDTDVFAMQISAAGEFYIDWGDGKTEWITKSDTTNMTFGHNYASKGTYNIRLGGQATAYNTSTSIAAISFNVGSTSAGSKSVIQTKIASIDGSLGAIFGTLPDTTENQPRFYRTFNNASNMKGAIPENLFAGISGALVSYMFAYTFYNCTSLTGPSARINGQYLYEIWPNATTSQVNDMYYRATGLSDYSNIPSAWK